MGTVMGFEKQKERAMVKPKQKVKHSEIDSEKQTERQKPRAIKKVIDLETMKDSD